jgi:hypothetical protein
MRAKSTSRVAWGPVCRRLRSEAGGLVVAPVRPEIDVPFVPMIASLAVGVRPEDQALRDDLDRAPVADLGRNAHHARGRGRPADRSAPAGLRIGGG